MATVIGIDLGTTNSCVAFTSGNSHEVIANLEGSRTTPSTVAFTEGGERLVGQIAKRQSATNPAQTLFAIKRLIGRKFDTREVESFRDVAPFEILAAENGDAWVDVNGHAHAPQEIAGLILQRMKETASEYLGEPVEAAVITVPAYFNDAQRQATKEAGLIAGLEVLRIINEPTAAALAYGIDEEEEKTVAVFDLGGGTFDVSVLELGDGVFQVLSTNGDTYLGGEDFDRCVVEHLANRFKDENGIDLRGDPMALQRLKEAAERAKHELSSVAETDVNLPFISSDASGPKHLELILRREELEEMVMPLVQRLEGPCLIALEDAGVDVSAIDEVILVGGMTRMPRIRAKVEEIFGRVPNTSVNPDEVVALGAAIQAGVLNGELEDVLLLDVTPLSLGVETQGGVFTSIIPKNTTIPTAKSQVFSTTEDGQELVRIHVLQGERELADRNMTLGRFELVGLPPAPRGVPQIEVTFSLDTDGVAHVSARDLGTGKSQSISVTASSGLTEEQVEVLIGEAEAQQRDDSERRERIELRNKLEGLVYSTEKTLAEFSLEIEAEQQRNIRIMLDDISSLDASVDSEDLRSRLEALSQATFELTEHLYARLAPESDPPEGDRGSSI